MMPCNPNIGGTSKGHLVREIDALGGEMGKNIDRTFIQSKMLNKSKGPAVHSLRAQADKKAYSNEMRKVLERTEHLTIKQAEVTELIVEDGVLKGVKTVSGATYYCKAAVLCTGVYLNARCIYGDVSTYTGPNGLQAATHLTDSLKQHGVEMMRSRPGRRPVWISVPLTFPKWKSSSEMRESYRFPFPQTRTAYRSIRYPAG